MNIICKIIRKAKRMLAPVFTFNKKKLYNNIALPFHMYKRTVIFETSFGWDGIMKQRPQQVASSFDGDTLVLYHSSKDSYEKKEKYKKIKDGVYVLNLDLYRKFLIASEELPSEKMLVVYSTDPVKLSLINKYKENGFTVVYEYVDDLSPALCSRAVYKKLVKKHDFMMSRKIKTVSTATRLYNNVKDRTSAVLATNGCDYEHFKAASYPVPPDMSFEGGRKIVGYYGAVAEWMDYELLRRIALDGKYEIVLIGMSYDGSFEKSGLNELDRIHFLGKKDYGALPAYSSNFDICMIPFLKNTLTASTSPVKLFEYMAAQKPIVTTALEECRKYKSVMTAEDHDDFIRKLDIAADKAGDPEYKELLKVEALLNTWESKCNTICDFAFDKR